MVQEIPVKSSRQSRSPASVQEDEEAGGRPYAWLDYLYFYRNGDLTAMENFDFETIVDRRNTEI